MVLLNTGILCSWKQTGWPVLNCQLGPLGLRETDRFPTETRLPLRLTARQGSFLLGKRKGQRAEGEL